VDHAVGCDRRPLTDSDGAGCLVQFGIEGGKLVLMKSLLNWINSKLEQALQRDNALNNWYDVTSRPSICSS
jgi:hypothetical protein